MRTVTSLCFAAVGGICLALFLLATVVAPIGWLIPAVALGVTLALVAGALAMARQAGTPRWLPLGVFSLVSVLLFGLFWSSW